jgi:hypothetical protein
MFHSIPTKPPEVVGLLRKVAHVSKWYLEFLSEFLMKALANPHTAAVGWDLCAPEVWVNDFFWGLRTERKRKKF